MQCPKCKTEMQDQRASKTGRQPDYQCPNPSCVNEKGFRTGVWLRGTAKAPAPTTVQPLSEPPVALARPEPPLPWETSPKDEQLVKLYWACFDEVLAGLKTRMLKDGFPGSEIAACVATMFIARSRLL
jgi:hypothetical protein